jgi:ElaB/YqjD/DUF883 family membrane-anchored ribosome-binding protein
MPEEMHEGQDLSAGRSEDTGNGGMLSSLDATKAVERLRSGIDQASSAMRDLTQVGGDWAQSLQERALDMTKELRSQGDRAVGTVSQQVEHHPLASLAVAFAMGFICASLIRR